MTTIGKIIELWRYPISSIAGERVERLDVSEAGIPRERDFGVVDIETGAVADPGREQRWQPALAIRSRIDGEGDTEICIAGVSWRKALSTEARIDLTPHFDFAAEIRPYRDRDAVPGHRGPWAVSRYEPSALHLLTTASLAELQALHPDGNPDRRRFRPNIMVEMGRVAGKFPETEWIGRMLRIGDLTLSISEPTRRCGMTVIGQPDIPYDPEILRQLVRNNGHNIGVYCIPATQGSIAVGDVVRLD